MDEKCRAELPDFCAIDDATIKLMVGESLSEDESTKLNEQLENKLNKDSRCNYEYYIGRAYDLQGKPELADAYWQKCVTRGPFTRYNATLAGKYLSDRHGTSRK